MVTPENIENSINSSSSNYPTIQINKSNWAIYNLTTSKVLNIKTKHLRVGTNTIKFFFKRDISERYVSGGVTIKEIRFDFAEIESLRAKFSKKNNIENKSATDKKKDNQLKKSDLKKLKAFNHSLNKGTRKYLQHALKHLGY